MEASASGRHDTTLPPPTPHTTRDHVKALPMPLPLPAMGASTGSHALHTAVSGLSLMQLRTLLTEACTRDPVLAHHVLLEAGIHVGVGTYSARPITPLSPPKSGSMSSLMAPTMPLLSPERRSQTPVTAHAALPPVHAWYPDHGPAEMADRPELYRRPSREHLSSLEGLASASASASASHYAGQTSRRTPADRQSPTQPGSMPHGPAPIEEPGAVHALSVAQLEHAAQPPARASPGSALAMGPAAPQTAPLPRTTTTTPPPGPVSPYRGPLSAPSPLPMAMHLSPRDPAAHPSSSGNSGGYSHSGVPTHLPLNPPHGHAPPPPASVGQSSANAPMASPPGPSPAPAASQAAPTATAVAAAAGAHPARLAQRARRAYRAGAVRVNTTRIVNRPIRPVLVSAAAAAVTAITQSAGASGLHSALATASATPEKRRMELPMGGPSVPPPYRSSGSGGSTGSLAHAPPMGASPGLTGPAFVSSEALDAAFDAATSTYVCELCQTSFGRKYDLERHLRAHAGVKPYPCGGCSKTFTRRDILQKHIQSFGRECERRIAARMAGSSQPHDTGGLYSAHSAS